MLLHNDSLAADMERANPMADCDVCVRLQKITLLSLRADHDGLKSWLRYFLLN